ncbi:MAG: B12-binding domain-containing radical SAM protein [Magnetococcales bacterium]|nr:B12-binding domain-containing radical SAM protein [Magnetococcales bacterium]
MNPPSPAEAPAQPLTFVPSAAPGRKNSPRRVAFVIDRIGHAELFSIPLLAAILKRDGHSVIFQEYDPDPKGAMARLQSFQPDALAYSITSTDSNKFLGMNRILKQATGAFSIFGGAHPTFFPDFIEKEGVDAICVGEGDAAFPALIGSLGSSAMADVSNFHLKLPGGEIVRNRPAPLVPDLDALPHPDRDMLYEASWIQREMPIRSFFAGRGCPYKCSYCFNHQYNAMYRGKEMGKIVRAKSVSRFLDEIQQVIRKYPTQFLKFHDDVFGVNKAWLAEFAERYPREIGLPYLCYARPNMVHAEYVDALQRSGCHAISIAVECGNETIRNQVLRRNMSSDDVRTAYGLIRERGIRIYSLNMLGLPGETEADLQLTVDLNRECRADFADASIFQPYPGTEITEYCVAHGWLEPGAASWESQFTRSLLNFPEAFKEKVETYHRMFPMLVDHPWLDRWLPEVERLRRTELGRKATDLAYRFYYGYFLQSRIYPAKVPLAVKAKAALSVLFSRNRT